MADIAAVTSIEITARDSTRSAIQSVQGGFNQLRNAAGSLSGVFAALGGALSIGAFASAIKGAIDYADQLNDLNKKTGIAVETLGGLGYAAQQTGTSLEAIAKGTSRLATTMAEAAGGSAKANAIFASMGLSAIALDGSLKPLDKMLFEIADKFEGYEEGAGLAAKANELFGERLGSQMIPFLVEGGKRLREMVAEYQRYGGVSAETAARADQFNDTLAKIQLMGGALWRTLASALLPTLQTVANIFVEAKEKAGGFGSVAEVVTVAVKGLAIAGLAVVEAFKAVGTAIGTVFATIQTYLTTSGFKPALDVLKEGFSDVGKSVGAAFANMEKIANASTASVAVATTTNLGKTKVATTALGDAAKKAGDGFKELAAAIMRAYEDALNWELAGQKIDEDLAKLNAELAEANTAMAVFVGHQHDAVRAYEDQTDAIGKTRAELDAMQLARQAEIRDLRLMAGWGQEAIDIYDKWAAAMARRQVIEAQQEQTAEMVRMWQQVDRAAEDAFTNILQGGKNAFDRLKDALKQGLMALLYQLTVRPFIINIAAAISGNAGVAGALGGAAGGGLGGGGNLLSLGSNLLGLGSGSSLLGTAGISGLFSGSGGIFGASAIGNSFALSGAGQALGLSAVGLDAAGGVALTSLGATLGAAIPIIGAVLAIAALAGAFDSEPSQVIGRFGVQAGTAGFEDNAYTSSRYGNLGFLDSGTQYFGGQAAQTFNSIIAGTLSAIGSRLTDAQNTSLASRLQSTDFGSFEGEYTTEEFIRKYGADILGKVISAGFAELDPLLQRQFDLFKGTADEMSEFANVLLTVHDLTKNIPTDLRETLIGVLDGGKEIAEQVIAFAQAYSVLQDVMNRDPLEDAFDAIAAATDSAYVRLGKTADAFRELIEAYDGSAEASKEIAAATAEYYQQLVNVIAGIRQLGRSIDEMFAGTIEDLTLQTLTDQGKKEYYQRQIELLYGQLGAATDPNDIERITRQINEYMRAAFGLLTPDEQVNLLSQYSAYAAQINQLAQERLAVAEAQAQRQADQLFAQLRDVMTEAANDFKAAAADQKIAATDNRAAARDMITAARTPLQITINEPVVNG